MPRPQKKEITFTKDSILSLMQEIYNELVEQRNTAIRIQNKMISMMKEPEDMKEIGPVLEKSLNELNITSYAQIANMTIKDLTNMLNEAGVNTKIYNLSGWKAQAKLALKGDFEAVKNWTKK